MIASKKGEVATPWNKPNREKYKTSAWKIRVSLEEIKEDLNGKPPSTSGLEAILIYGSGPELLSVSMYTWWPRPTL